MSKNKNLNKKVLVSENEEVSDTMISTDDGMLNPAKEEKNVKVENKQKNKDSKDIKTKKEKKPKDKKLRRKARETVSELKKVAWPSFGEVCKKTGVVLSVVIIFGLVLFGLDTLLGYLFGLLT